MIALGRGLSLLLGGARSGKSDLAVKLGETWPGDVTFVATATAGDDDMAARIERHQTERPRDWALLEAPQFDAAMVNAITADSLVIVDCLTMLVSNLMFGDSDESVLDEPAILEHVNALSTALADRAAPTLLISNEVGLGIHPETAMGRTYRDILGRANRTIAANAETSLFVAAGKVLPLSDLNVTW